MNALCLCAKNGFVFLDLVDWFKNKLKNTIIVVQKGCFVDDLKEINKQIDK